MIVMLWSQLRRLLSVMLMAFALASAMPAAHAVEPDEVLADPQLELRARDLSAVLRCLVCRNQSIDDSNAPLARDLRLLVRERLKAGDTDAQVRDFVVARYGDFVLLKPPFSVTTLLLWIAPLLALLGAIALAWRTFGDASEAKPARAASRPLTAEEEAKLKKLVGPGRS